MATNINIKKAIATLDTRNGVFLSAEYQDRDYEWYLEESPGFYFNAEDCFEAAKFFIDLANALGKCKTKTK